MLQHEFEEKTMSETSHISADLFAEINADYMRTNETKDEFCARVYGTENSEVSIIWKTIRSRQEANMAMLAETGGDVGDSNYAIHQHLIRIARAVRVEP